MRVRTYLGLLLALAAVFLGSYVTHHNQALLYEPFHLGKALVVPLWVALLVVFLLGFLPTLTLLMVASVRRDLALRDERKKNREVESIQASFRRAADLASDGQWERAQHELEVVLSHRPKDFAPLLAYGAVLRSLGRLDQAVEVHQRASVQFPSSIALLYELAEDYEARGESEVAREIRSRVLRDFPGYGRDVLRRRRNAALGAGQFQLASELTARMDAFEGAHAAAEEPRETSVRRGLEYQRGVTALEAERAPEAKAVFEKLLREESRFIPAAIMQGEAQLLADEQDAAVETWLAGYRRTGSPVFLARIEDYFIEREDPRRAIETLKRLIAEDSVQLLPRYFLGRLYYRVEMHEEALKAFEGLDERIGSSPMYYFVLGRLRERRGELKLAAEAYATCARQLGVHETQFRCRVCREPYSEWQDRCPSCGSWSSVELELEEEHGGTDAIRQLEAVIWAGPESWDLADLDEPKAAT